VSEEQSWLIALSMEELSEACKAAGVKVAGFRHLTQVPRLLLERQIQTILTKHGGQTRSAKLREALAKAWRERYPTLARVAQTGLAEPVDDRSEFERVGEWLAGLSRAFGRAPVLMGVGLHEIKLPLAVVGEEFFHQLESYWPADAPLLPAPAAPPEAAPEAAAPVPRPEEEVVAAEERSEWRQERGPLRAKLKSLSQENQALQRARTSAEHRAAHYQSLVQQARAEMEALASRTDWPQPAIMTQRLIRGLMEARRRILELELANTELRAALEQATAASAAASDHRVGEDE
jgi:hypothetical protein